ncbi:hypothetical protein CAJAP_08924 [Camponotus japonicus]
MGLNLALPLSAFFYLLPSNISSDFGKTAITATNGATELEQLNNIVAFIDVPTEIRKDNGKVEDGQGYSGPLYPLGIIKPTIGADGTKLNVDFQAKVESKKHPNHAGISMNVQLAKQGDIQQSHDVSSEKRKELSSEDQRIKSLTRVFLKNGNMKDASVLHLSDITDTLIEKSGKGNKQVASRNADGKNSALNRIKKKNYIRLCRRSIDGSTENLMQKLRDCLKHSRSDFYLEHDTKITNEKKNMTGLVGLRIETKNTNGNDYKDSESDEHKQQNIVTETLIIPDDSINYEEVNSKVDDKLGISLKIKKSVVDGKIDKLELIH